MMGEVVCEHMRLGEADIKKFCKKPKQVKCSKCTLLLSVISDGIYICLLCGRQACKKHIAVENNDCDCNLFHKINTKEIWCLECNIETECISEFGDALFERYQAECVHLQRNYFAKAPQPIKFRKAPFLWKCHKCTDLPDENGIKFFICLECGKKTCCIEEAKLHNRLNFYHYLSLDTSTKLLHCLNCQKEFNPDEFERYVHLKQQFEDALGYNKPRDQTLTSSPTKPLPLNNTGNICYFIAIVQNLRNCTQLNRCYASVISGNRFKQSYVICEETIEVDCEVKPVTAAVLKVLNADNQRELQLYLQDLMNLIRKKNKRFSMGTQQDSHEALRQIFDELREEEINNVKSKIRSKFETEAGEKSSKKENDSQLKDYLYQAVKIQTVVDKVFGGKTVNTVICRECFNVLQIVESQLDFSLPVSDNTSTSENQSEKKPSTSFAEDQLELRDYLKIHNFHHQYLDKDYPVKPFTIEHCLQSFITLDILDENNKFVCDKCVSTKAECLCSKQLLIHSLPPVLILHLKRFHLYPKVAKNNTHIIFPVVLNMAPFCTDKCFELTLPGKADDMKGKILYALKGVIVHKGSLQFGHYYTFLRTTEKLPSDYQHDAYHDELSKIEGDWYCANDNSITRISDVQSGMPAKVDKSPGYLLFYERL